MIIDLISNLNKYDSILRIDKIVEFISKNDISGLKEGDIQIDGDNLFVKVLKYIPKKAEENNFETHNIYTDIQVIVEGVEVMQTAPKDCLRELDCDSQGDFQFFKSDEGISSFVVRKNDFVVFFSGEAHKPACRYKDSEDPVIKLVFKIKRGDFE